MNVDVWPVCKSRALLQVMPLEPPNHFLACITETAGEVEVELVEGAVDKVFNARIKRDDILRAGFRVRPIWIVKRCP